MSQAVSTNLFLAKILIIGTISLIEVWGTISLIEV
jgi:hypothetical protein